MGHSCKDGEKVAPRQFPPPPPGVSTCKNSGNVAPRLLPSPRVGGTTNYGPARWRRGPMKPSTFRGPTWSLQPHELSAVMRTGNLHQSLAMQCRVTRL